MNCCKSLKTIFGQCSRPGTVLHNGQVYCWQHSPQRTEEKRAKQKQERLDKYLQDQTAERNFEQKIKLGRLKKQAGLDDLTESDLLKIIERGGILIILKNM